MGSSGGQIAFPTTRWNIVLAAGGAVSNESRRALGELCAQYREPLLHYLRRSGQFQRTEAEDLLQGFFASLLEGRAVAPRDPSTGLFRWYLLGALKHYVRDAHKRATAQKRGGTAVIVPLDDERTTVAQMARDENPERAFERRWAMTVLETALGRVCDRYHDEGKRHVFDGLRLFITGAPTGGYARTAEDLEMTEAAVRVAVHRLRRRFGTAIRAVVGETVPQPSDIEDEVRYLAHLLGHTD